VLAGTIAVGLVMLVSAAGALLAADWRAEVASRHAWAEAAPALAEWDAGIRAQGADIDRRYPPAFVSYTLREVFRVRHLLPPQAAAIMELPPQAAAIMELPPPALACPRAGGQALPTRAASEAAQGTAPERVSDASARLGHGSSIAKPANSLAVLIGRQTAPGYCSVAGSRIRLVVNAGSNWPESDQAVLRPATRSHAATVIVLRSCGNAQSARPADAGTEVASATGTESPSCRGPPTLEKRRSVCCPAIAALRAAPASDVSSNGDPVVLDNLGQPVPVCAAELNVIETYLGDVLEELLASSKASSESKRT
jgi:hypothetical protein